MTPHRQGSQGTFSVSHPKLGQNRVSSPTAVPPPFPLLGSILTILGIWGWVDNGYRRDCERGEKGIRKQMEQEKEAEGWGRDTLSWVWLLPWYSLICHFLPAPEDARNF